MADLYVKVTMSHWNLPADEPPQHYSAIQTAYQVEYIPNRWTRPRTSFPSKLFVYQDLKHAIENAHLHATLDSVVAYTGEIAWWCECTNPTSVNGFLWGPPDYKIKEYWDTYNAYGYVSERSIPYYYRRRYTGTLFADEVKIISCVTNSDIKKVQG